MDSSILLCPQKQHYFKVCKTIMSLLGIWPADNVGGGGGVTIQWFLFSAWLLYFMCTVSAMVHYVARHMDEDIYQVCHLLASCLIASFAIPHLIVPLTHKRSYRELFKVFYTNMHLAHYPAHDDYTMKILQSKEEMAAKAVKIMTLGCVTGATFYALVPVAFNVSSGAFTNRTVKLESVLSLTMPFDTEHSVTGWALLTIVSFPIIYVTPLIGVYTALVFLFFVSHLDGHLDILKHNLSHLPAPDSLLGGGKRDTECDCYSSVLEDIVSRHLENFVRHYTAILRFRALIQTVYGELFLCIYLFNMIGYCLVLLQLTRGLSDGAIRYGVIAAILLAQMSFFSLALEDLYTKLNGIRLALYETPWYAMRERNKRTLLFSMRVTDRVSRFRAAGMVDVSAPVMLSVGNLRLDTSENPPVLIQCEEELTNKLRKSQCFILKTTLSYFAFLRTSTKKS